MSKSPKTYANSAARWWYERRIWQFQEIDQRGNALDIPHRAQSRDEAAEAAHRILERRARQLRQFPACSPYVSDLRPIYRDLIGSSEFYVGARPSRAPYFYRHEAITWARMARHSSSSMRETCRALAKQYLGSYRASLAKWGGFFGV